MGNSEDGKSSKPEKSSPQSADQTGIHVYPDWAAMQAAYYGPRVAVPPYFNAAVASGHPPHPYMWAPPQSMMTPYGAPYAALYAHGGVYPGVTLNTASLGMDTPTKSSANSDQSLVKKLKEFDGLAMTIGYGNGSNSNSNGNADSAEAGANNGISQSSSGDTEGSSDGGSSGSTAEANQKGKKRSREGTPINGGDGKGNSQTGPPVGKEVKGAADNVVSVAVVPAHVGEKVMGAAISHDMTTVLELKSSTAANAKSNPNNGEGVPAEAWLQNERELKRERRKQSNRESARRSRLRKQAEAEELAKKVQSLTAENMSLKSEINKLTENSEKLKLENSAIVEKLNIARAQKEPVATGEIDDKRQQPVHTADLLARVNNSGSLDDENEEKETYENKKSGRKLYPLLCASPRTDAVAAG